MSHEDIVMHESGESMVHLRLDIVTDAQGLVAAYRALGRSELLKQAVDAPRRAKAKLAKWMADYDARPGNQPGDAEDFLADAMRDYGKWSLGNPYTFAELTAFLNDLEADALQIVALRNGGATWDQVADATEAMYAESSVERITLHGMAIPVGYTTIWGEPW